MLGIYFSGTGNTKHCIEKLTGLLDITAKVIPLEADNVVKQIEQNNMIILGYPVQYSNAPIMVRDFIQSNARIWSGKKILCVATMGLFSGDGSGCAARLLKKYGAVILGGLHLRMPDSICDVKLLKKSLEDNRKIIAKADEKITMTAQKIKSGKYPKEGITFFAHIAGLFGQRLWFYKQTKAYSDKLKINDACIGCGLCSSLCPMKNIKMEHGKAKAGNRCTMCYRCISSCPKQAITLIGNRVQQQCRFEKYME